MVVRIGSESNFFNLLKRSNIEISSLSATVSGQKEKIASVEATNAQQKDLIGKLVDNFHKERGKLLEEVNNLKATGLEQSREIVSIRKTNENLRKTQKNTLWICLGAIAVALVCK